MSKEIFFVVHSFNSGALGGVNRVVAETANELSKDPNNKVNILSFSEIEGTAYPLENNIEIHSLGMKKYSTQFFKGIFKFFWFYLALKELMSFIVKVNDRNIAWNLTSPPLIMLYSLFVPKKYGKQIYCEHVSPLRETDRIVYPILRNYLLKRGDAVISLNKKDQEYYVNKGINAVLIHNGVKFSKPTANLKSKKIIFVGRFVYQKNPFDAIEIFKESGIYEKGYTLTFYGYGEYESRMREIISKDNLDAYIEIITTESDPDNIYKDANCLIMTSNFEGLPMVLIEATSRGIPCISYDCPEGPSEIIKSGINGELIKMGDKQHFCDALNNLDNSLYDPHKVINSVQEFNIEKVSKYWKSLIKEDI